MRVSEFDFIAKSSNINNDTCNFRYDGTFITYFHIDHNSGNSLTGRFVEIPNVYDIMARESEFTSVKIVKPKDVLVYIKRIFGAWEEEDA
jgi:hypothetical protein